MTKQELAESMAEFLGYVLEGGVWSGPRCMELPLFLHEKVTFLEEQTTPEQFFFSPDGFFAVWDAYDKKYHGDHRNMDFMQKVVEKIYCGPTDRYTAFYSAVHDLTKTIG